MIKNAKKFILPLTVLISFSLIIWLVRPVYYQVKSLRSEFEIKTETLAIREKVVEDLEKIQETFEDLGEELDKVTFALPSEPETAELLVQIEAIAAENGLLLESIDFKETEDEKPKAVLVTLELTGTYEAFKNFLSSVEKSLRIMDVLSINFQPFSEELSDLYSFSIELKAFWQ